MPHKEVKNKISHKSEAALKVILFRLWLISSGKARKKIERMLGYHRSKKSKRSKRRKKSNHPMRSKRRGSMTKAEARKHFLKILPKINAGRRKKGLKPIHVKGR